MCPSWLKLKWQWHVLVKIWRNWTSYISCRAVKWFSHFRKLLANSPKCWTLSYHKTHNSLLGVYPRELKACEMAAHSSTLAWRIPWTEEPAGQQSKGLQKSWTGLKWILQARLQQYVNCELPDVQAGFRKGRGTTDQIANIWWIMEKAREFQKYISFCFIDYAKAFVYVDHNELWKILKEMGIPDHLTCLLRNL